MRVELYKCVFIFFSNKITVTGHFFFLLWTDMETFPAVKYSRLGGTEEQELPYTCNTSKTYGTSGSRYQIVHGHRNPLDVEKTVSAKTH